MTLFLTNNSSDNVIPIYVVAKAEFPIWNSEQSDFVSQWLSHTQFEAESGEVALVPDKTGGLAQVIVGLGDTSFHWIAGKLAESLPSHEYCLQTFVGIPKSDHISASNWFSLAWALGAYRFNRYRPKKPSFATLVWPLLADRDYVTGAYNAATLTRDLINTPAEDMGPDALYKVAYDIALEHKAIISEVRGEELLDANLPAIYAVGRAAAKVPRLIDFSWGNESSPKVTLIGKGVCFDTGGLDLKPSSGMRLMKKDMGGAAVVLGLSQWIMAAKLDMRLRVLIPAVENAVSGNAFRPGDVVNSRDGKKIEIGNTDAEGRVILADALTLACEDDPGLVIDCATLTGAARVALGPDIPAMFTDDDQLAAEIMSASQDQKDPIWRLPMWEGYNKMNDSKIADITNSGSGGFAGAITAALFLKKFMLPDVPWVHIDLYGWGQSDRPGRPAGGLEQCQRALFVMLNKKYNIKG